MNDHVVDPKSARPGGSVAQQPMGDSLRIPQFRDGSDPPGTLRWIHWIDDIRPGQPGRPSCPTVRVYLDRLPHGTRPEAIGDLDLDGILRPADFNTKREPPLPFLSEPIDAALLPRLFAGLVFADGEPVAAVPWIDGDFTFEGRHTEVAVRGAEDEGIAPLKPPDWNDAFDWKMLSAARHDRGWLFKNGSLVVLTDERDGRTLLIPAFEVFARMVAPAAPIVKTLLKGHWDDHRHELVNTRRTRKTADGCEIVLRHHVPMRFRHILHLLNFDPKGRMAAKSSYAAIQEAGVGASIRKPNVCVPVRTSLPFVLPDRYRIKVRGFRPYPKVPNLFVALQITESSWPEPDVVIRYDQELGRTGDEVELVDEPPPHPPMPTAVPERRDHAAELEVEEAPSTGLPPLHYDAPAMKWLDAPEGQLLPKPKSKRYTGQRREADAPDTTGTVGFGEADGRGGAIPGSANADPHYERSIRFDLVMGMFTRLRHDEKVIERSSFVRAPPGRRALVGEGRISAWRFPLFVQDGEDEGGRTWCAWSRIDPADTGPRELARARPALVVATALAGRDLLSITTMLRPKERSYASLVACRDESRTAQIQALLEICAEKEGVWPAPNDDVWWKKKVVPGQRWIHRMTGPRAARVLSPVSFLNAVEALD